MDVRLDSPRSPNWHWAAHSDERSEDGLTKHNAIARLMIPSEERAHPWAKDHLYVSSTQQGLPMGLRGTGVWNVPLLRYWDSDSGSIPHPDTRRMLARDSTIRLDTYEIRKETLQSHLYPTIKKATPYISFSSCAGFVDLDMKRREKDGKHQRLTLIDPQTRLRLQLPILKFVDEFKHYKLYNPSRADVTTGHWMCLWEVTPEEVVWTWNWDELKDNPEWYWDVVEPALRTFQATGRRPGESQLQ
jgi:hypothetical protein